MSRRAGMGDDRARRRRRRTPILTPGDRVILATLVATACVFASSATRAVATGGTGRISARWWKSRDDDDDDDAFAFDSSARRMLEESSGTDTHIALYLIIPFMSAIVGYATNIVALQMTFYPLEFFPSFLKFAQVPGQPFGLLGGWQGIIPSKAGKMAGILTDLMTTKLIDVAEMFGRIVPHDFAEVLAPAVKASTYTIFSDIMNAEAPFVWKSLPNAVQQDIVLEVMGGVPEFLEGLTQDLIENIYEVLDIKSMTVGLAEANKALVVKMFREVGDKEFVIIERSGGYFGFIFGVFQMIIFYIVDVYEPEYSGPLLPVFGFMVGWLTNWVALKLIFRPIEPTPVCCGAFVIQGAFLKRQEAVSEKFAALNAELFCNAHNIWDEMMHGAKKEQFNAMIKKHATTFFDRTVGGSGAMVAKTLFGKETFERVRGGVADGLVKQLPSILPISYDYQDEVLLIEDTVREAMRVLPPAEFEGVLHPVFEEDEIKLIFVGGVLGALVGLAQYTLIFAS